VFHSLQDGDNRALHNWDGIWGRIGHESTDGLVCRRAVVGLICRTSVKVDEKPY
jgi:hypothetical protein